jgi:signal peptidase I
MALQTKNAGVGGWVQTIAIGRRPQRTMLRLGVLISVAAIAFVILRYWLVPVHIIGPSMLPTFKDGSINFVNRFAYRKQDPQRGDIVAIQYSAADLQTVQPHLMLVKRIVGLPGESISFADGRLCVNGKPLDEPYLKYSSDWQHPATVLGPDEYYFVGDNRSMPFDYHEKGAADRRRIVGKVLLDGGS